MLERLEKAKEIAAAAGGLGMTFFADISKLDISAKGHQDLVSNADLDVETFVRTELAKAFPQDGIVGEEHAPVASKSGWTWVIDPIDGTANFVKGIPAWCVILACVRDDKTRIGVIHNPNVGETFWSAEGTGAHVNDRALSISSATSFKEGRLGIGSNGRTSPDDVPKLLGDLIGRGGLFYHNSSGGLMLAYVAAGRLLGYAEAHMNAWDCLAGQLLIAEAGGRVEDQSADDMIANGGRVIAGPPALFDEILAMAQKAYRA